MIGHIYKCEFVCSHRGIEQSQLYLRGTEKNNETSVMTFGVVAEIRSGTPRNKSQNKPTNSRLPAIFLNWSENAKVCLTLGHGTIPPPPSWIFSDKGNPHPHNAEVIVLRDPTLSGINPQTSIQAVFFSKTWLPVTAVLI